MFHKLTRALAGLLFDMKDFSYGQPKGYPSLKLKFCSVGRMNSYAAPSQTFPIKQNPARALHSHLNRLQNTASKSLVIITRIYETSGLNVGRAQPALLLH